MKIYAVKISNIIEEKINSVLSLIDFDKKNKILRLINKKDKIRTLIGEILIRNIIREELSIRNEQVIFSKNQYGKPYMKEYPQFNFNISHSGDFVVVAIDDKPIGIDIEEIKHIDYKEISERFFSVNEFNYIVNENSDIGLYNFYEIWTLKESYIKCCGKGLSIPLKSFSIYIGQDETIKIIINNKYKKYVFKRFNVDSCYKMAVCALNKEIPNNITMIDPNSLIDNYLRGYLK